MTLSFFLLTLALSTPVLKTHGSHLREKPTLYDGVSPSEAFAFLNGHLRRSGVLKHSPECKLIFTSIFISVGVARGSAPASLVHFFFAINFSTIIVRFISVQMNRYRQLLELSFPWFCSFVFLFKWTDVQFYFCWNEQNIEVEQIYLILLIIK